MGLDIRLPIGIMFTFLGVTLTLYGLLTASSAETYRPSLGINMNLWWGLVLLGFGAVMLVLAGRGRKADASKTGPEDKK